MNNLIYLICPVRRLTSKQELEISAHVALKRDQGYDVKCPYADTDQNDEVGLRIVKEHENDILERDIIHIYWDPTSKGSLWDLAQVRFLQIAGMKKKIIWIKDNPSLAHYRFVWDSNASIQPQEHLTLFKMPWKDDDKLNLWKMAQIRMLRKINPEVFFYIQNIEELYVDPFKSYKNVMIATSLELENCSSREKLKKELNSLKRMVVFSG